MGDILTGALGAQALIVSSHSEGAVLSFQDGVWSTINIANARGLAVSDNLIAVASHESFRVYDRVTGSLSATLHVSSMDSHEIAFGADNSLIACASYRSALTRHGVGVDEVLWTVPGVTAGSDDARSWINGVATVDGQPRYVTVLGISDEPQGWRDEARASRGVLIDTTTNEVVLGGLMFPHSPNLIDGVVWFAESGHSRLCRWAPGDATATVVATMPGWTRGITKLGEYLLVGISQGRLTAFPELTNDPLAQPGVAVVDRATGEMVDFVSLDVREIFDVKVTDRRLS
jgi:uncharacterized protein (TIGR03032 family)